MSDERQRFFELLELEGAEARAGYLARIGLEDPELQHRLAELLAAHEKAGGFMQRSAPAAAGGTDGSGSVTVPEVPLAEGPGSVIGDYKLLQKIGEGGFGVVYMAEQRAPVKRRVAFKIIKLGMDTRQVVGRFEAERQALAMMDHPNIATVFDGGATETGRPYFVMELVRGVPITQFCDEHRLDTAARLRLIADVCDAIHHAHQKGILHRDIKPGNVMVTMHDARPVPKVIDFGIAKAMQQELTEITIFTRYHEMIGTPAYMSPEQAQWSGLDLDTRTDIYSLGVLLYEMLTGSTPFDGRELMTAGLDEMRRRIREEEPLKPSTRLKTLQGPQRTELARARGEDPDRLGSRLRGDLDWIVMKALEKDRGRRYDSAAAFALDIRRFLADEPVSAAAPSPVYRLRKFTARHRMLVAAAACGAVVVAGAMATVAYHALRASRAEAAALEHLHREQRQRAALEAAQVERDLALEQLQREAAISSAVVRFLNEDIFAGVDPGQSAERELSVRTLIERARRQLHDSFHQQPEIEAAVRHAVAATLLTLGEAASAADEAAEALRLRRATLGVDARLTLESQLLLARARSANQERTEARALVEETLARARDRWGASNLLTAAASYRLAALIQYEADQRNRARELIDHAVTVGRADPAVEPRDFMTMLQVQGRIHAREHGPAAGEALHREAVAYGAARLGENHPWTASARGTLAGYLCDWNRQLPEAEQLARSATIRLSQVLGDSHPLPLATRAILTLVLWRQAKWPEALREQLVELQLRTQPGAALDTFQVLLKRHPLQSLGVAGDGARLQWWRREEAPAEGDPSLPSPASGWLAGASSVGTNSWWRGVLDVDERGGFTPILLARGPGDLEVRVNGSPAGLRAPHVHQGLQLLVFSQAACAQLRPGRNVIEVTGRHLDPRQPVTLELLRGPDLSSQPSNVL